MLRVSSLVCAVMIAGTAAIASAAQSGSKIGAGVAARVAGSAQATVVVALNSSQAPGKETAAQRKKRISAHVDSILSVLPAGSFKIRRRFANVDAITIDMSSPALAPLTQNADVVRVDLDVVGGAQMIEAAQVSSVADVRSLGLTGKGIKAAVIDTGAQLDHADLADSIVDQDCFCSSINPGAGCCPDGSDTQTGSGSGLDANGHGTNVTGIITGNGRVAPQGGAPDASVVIVRVMDAQARFNSTSDIVAALDWIATNHPDTRVINMSLGTDALFDGACDNATAWTMALKQAIDAVTANGTIVTASSGNAASPTSISAPACISGVIAVGATWDATMSDQSFLGCTDSGVVAGKPTCFTNSNALVAIYAPGAYTTSTGSNVDPATTNGIATYGGTSQAAPLVASCVADLLQMQPRLSPAQIRTALTSSTLMLTDPKNGLTFPRLDCLQSMAFVDQLFDTGFDSGS